VFIFLITVRSLYANSSWLLR